MSEKIEKIISNFFGSEEISDLLMRFAEGELHEEDITKEIQSRLRVVLEKIKEEQNGAG